jgi:calcineurin-like phosphoesterase family protein
MSTFFTADLHFGHANIMKYCNRPFDSVEEMNDHMITGWVERVKPGDTVYILGDFGFADANEISRILDRLPGQKFLVYGNHDKTIKKNANLRDKFVKCCDYLEISVPDSDAKIPRRGAVDGTAKARQDIVLSHYAHLVWNKSHHGSWMLHGHSHGSLSYPYDVKILDVGVDAHGFVPLSYEEVKEIMKTKGNRVIDHHGA